MTDLEIVPMTVAHTEAAHALELRCFSDPWRAEDFQAAISTPGQIFFAALSDQKLIGFAGMWQILDEADILNIAVSPEYRRRGVGQALLQTLCTVGRQNDVRTFFLEVRAGNLPAQALYRSFSFVPYGTRTAYYKNPREDAVLMRLDLPACEDNEYATVQR